MEWKYRMAGLIYVAADRSAVAEASGGFRHKHHQENSGIRDQIYSEMFRIFIPIMIVNPLNVISASTMIGKPRYVMRNLRPDLNDRFPSSDARFLAARPAPDS